MYFLCRCIQCKESAKRIVQQHREPERQLHKCDKAEEVIDVVDALSVRPVVESKNEYHA